MFFRTKFSGPRTNDGVLVCGTSVLDAFDHLECLESITEALINSRPLGPVAPCPRRSPRS